MRRPSTHLSRLLRVRASNGRVIASQGRGRHRGRHQPPDAHRRRRRRRRRGSAHDGAGGAGGCFRGGGGGGCGGVLLPLEEAELASSISPVLSEPQLDGLLLALTKHLMRAAIRGTQRPSEATQLALRGHQRPLSWQSEAVRGHQWPSEALRGHQRPLSWHSEAIRGHQSAVSGTLSCAIAAARAWRSVSSNGAPADAPVVVVGRRTESSIVQPSPGVRAGSGISPAREEGRRGEHLHGAGSPGGTRGRWHLACDRAPLHLGHRMRLGDQEQSDAIWSNP